MSVNSYRAMGPFGVKVYVMLVCHSRNFSLISLSTCCDLSGDVQHLHCAIFLHDVTSVNKWLIAADLGTCYQLHTADVRVQSQSYPYGICGGRINAES